MGSVCALEGAVHGGAGDPEQLGELGAGAERDMTLKLSSTTALHGDAAATFGRDLLLERATGG